MLEKLQSYAQLKIVHIPGKTNTKSDKMKDPTCFNDGLTWKTCRMLVPKAMYKEVISKYHYTPVAGHWGVDRTCCLLKRRYEMPHLRRLVTRYCRTCDACQRAKSHHHHPRGLIEQIELPVRKWSSIAIDWTNLPQVKDGAQTLFNQVLTVTDRATKQVIIIQ